jgi:hypothetical protein
MWCIHYSLELDWTESAERDALLTPDAFSTERGSLDHKAIEQALKVAGDSAALSV